MVPDCNKLDMVAPLPPTKKNKKHRRQICSELSCTLARNNCFHIVVVDRRRVWHLQNIRFGGNSKSQSNCLQACKRNMSHHHHNAATSPKQSKDVCCVCTGEPTAPAAPILRELVCVRLFCVCGSCFIWLCAVLFLLVSARASHQFVLLPFCLLFS